jgi:hypothetical protein
MKSVWPVGLLVAFGTQTRAFHGEQGRRLARISHCASISPRGEKYGPFVVSTARIVGAAAADVVAKSPFAG